MKKTLLVTCSAPPSLREEIQGALEGEGEILYLEDISEDRRKEALSSANVLFSFFFNKEVREEEYPLLADLDLFQSISAGLDFLPFEKLPEKMILACNAGGWAPQIAEHTLGLLLALTRRIIPLSNDLAGGKFNRQSYTLSCLRDKIMTVARYGGIGRKTAELARCFGMKIRALNTSGRTADSVDFAGTLSDLPRVLPDTDVLLLSLPLNRHTRGIIGRKELDMMKKDAILLNVARAPLVVEDLYRHLGKTPTSGRGLTSGGGSPPGGAGISSPSSPSSNSPTWPVPPTTPTGARGPWTGLLPWRQRTSGPFSAVRRSPA
ncbi:2-hydroxyacid dehydrogenase [Aminivibrio sp.]